MRLVFAGTPEVAVPSLDALLASGHEVAAVLTLLDLPDGAEVLGPVPDEEQSRVVLRVPRADGPALSRALGELQRLRSARKLDPVRVQVDPPTL